MVHLPVLTGLRVVEYGLFPGNPPGSGIDWSFGPGATVVAGINGLGKTTLLMMVLRALTGPYDLTGDGGPQLLSVALPESPVLLDTQHTRLFRRRVADEAEKAKVTLSARIGDGRVSITRRLNDLGLERLEIDDGLVELPGARGPREALFQSSLSGLMGLGSFVDVLLILHHVILFYESRPGALWDPNAQRQLLRALCLDPGDAQRVAALERELQSADSRARNVQARITTTLRRWRAALKQEAEEEGILAKLAAEQALLDADLEQATALDGELAQIDGERREARLGHERAKLAREESDGGIERLKYTILLRRFPTMDATARMVLSRIMTHGQCLVCHAPAGGKRRELEEQLEAGFCPVCGAEPGVQDGVVLPHEFDQAKLEQERNRAELARLEEATQQKWLQDSSERYEQTLERLAELRAGIEERTRRSAGLRKRLPDTVTSKEYENALESLRRERAEWEELRALRLQYLRTLFAERKEAITGKSAELVEAFAALIEVLLVEEARLVQVSAEPDYLQAPGQAGERVQVPAYAAEMRAAARPTYVPRRDPSEVSESQREIIDLAFRLALVEVFGGSCTFAMETPEASLDGVAMERVGRALAAFAGREENRLVVTSNLTNAGVIGALFDATDSGSNVASRMRRVINLLEVAVPNRALLEDRPRYEDLLLEAVSGSGA